MARTLLATALAQAIVPVIALIIGKLQITSGQELGYVLVVMAVNAFFVSGDLIERCQQDPGAQLAG